MASNRARGLMIAASAFGLLVLSSSSATTFADAQSLHADKSTVTIIWQGPFVTEASCEAEVAYEKTQSDTLNASCSYRDYAPIQLGGAYDPGWYNYWAVESGDE
jgi:hypothetical protein